MQISEEKILKLQLNGKNIKLIIKRFEMMRELYVYVLRTQELEVVIVFHKRLTFYISEWSV